MGELRIVFWRLCVLILSLPLKKPMLTEGHSQWRRHVQFLPSVWLSCLQKIFSCLSPGSLPRDFMVLCPCLSKPRVPRFFSRLETQAGGFKCGRHTLAGDFFLHANHTPVVSLWWETGRSLPPSPGDRHKGGHAIVLKYLPYSWDLWEPGVSFALICSRFQSWARDGATSQPPGSWTAPDSKRL